MKKTILCFLVAGKTFVTSFIVNGVKKSGFCFIYGFQTAETTDASSDEDHVLIEIRPPIKIVVTPIPR